MASNYPDPSCEASYSLPPRSRPGSTPIGNILQEKPLVQSPRAAQADLSRPDSAQSFPQSPASSAYLKYSQRQQQAQQHQSQSAASSGFLPTPNSQTLSFPLLSPRVNADWSENEPEPAGAPLVRVEPAFRYPNASPSTQPRTESTMSAVAMQHHQYEPRFDMGPRPSPSFTWPVLESSGGMLSHEMTSYGGSDASVSPPAISRSDTASPPRSGSMITPERRELKRQMEKARRDAKLSHRAQRTNSTSSSGTYITSPPSSMSELSSPNTVYTTAPATMSMLTEPLAATMAPPSYMPMADHSNLFNSQYPPPLPSSYMSSMEFNAYTPPPHSSQYPRSHMGSEQMIYPVHAQPVMPQQQDGAHVRVVQSRPKPQCWEHGCNGRQFSTFSNLLRHQREKSGQAAKASCPNCGAEFTRTTARNGHLLHDKCKQRRNS